MTYREAGRSPLGEVRHRFVIGRRPRYLGSANAVARSTPLSPGGMILPSTGRAPSLTATRRPPTGIVEVCDHGLRVRAPDSVLELLWDQIVDVQRVEDPSGLVGLVVRGPHGEEVHFDRMLRGLGELARLLAQRHP
ncbi:MAG TPA: hypothetical protein VM261_25165 [Kofleriaceae bacterium]|nr:hypothetical protein [Kofleriaceae bacterium]